MILLSNHHTARSTLLKVLLTIIILAPAGGLIYGSYVWQHHKVEKLETQVDQLSTELNSATKPQPISAITSEYISKKGVAIKVYIPASNSSVVSPVIIMGEVPGNWSFEASFPVRLLDSKDNIVAEASARLLGDWMTDKPVAFTAILSFASAPSSSGTLLLQKDNPSGLDANDDSVSIPIILK